MKIVSGSNYNSNASVVVDGNRWNCPILKHEQKRLKLSEECTLVTGSGLLFRHVDPNDKMWDGDGNRIFRGFVPFVSPVERAPHIVLSLTGIDASHDHNLRLNLHTEVITSEGFIVAASTWSDTKLASIEISWTAYCQSVQSRVAELTQSTKT